MISIILRRAAKNINLIKRTMSSSFPYSGTTDRGLTKEIKIQVPYGHIAGKTWGDNKHDPVLCLHGWLDNCNTFDKLIPLLPKDNFYVAIDFPGHGLSSHIPVGSWYLNTENMACIKRTYDYFKWDQFTLLGHSMGGNMSGYFCAMYPELIKKCIVIDALGVFVNHPGQTGGSYIRASIDGYLKFESQPQANKTYSYEDAKARLLKANSQLSNEAADILLERGLQYNDDGKYSFRRDIRHIIANPHVTGETTWLEILGNINTEIYIFNATKGNLLLYKKSFQELLEKYSKCVNGKSNFQLLSAEGNHHLHLCDPQSISPKITDILLTSKLANQL